MEGVMSLILFPVIVLGNLLWLIWTILMIYWGWYFYESFWYGVLVCMLWSIIPFFMFFIPFWIMGGTFAMPYSAGGASILQIVIFWNLIFGNLSLHQDLKRNYYLTQYAMEDQKLRDKFWPGSDYNKRPSPYEIHRRILSELDYYHGDSASKLLEEAGAWCISHSYEKNGLPSILQEYVTLHIDGTVALQPDQTSPANVVSIGKLVLVRDDTKNNNQWDMDVRGGSRYFLLRIYPGEFAQENNQSLTQGSIAKDDFRFGVIGIGINCSAGKALKGHKENDTVSYTSKEWFHANPRVLTILFVCSTAEEYAKRFSKSHQFEWNVLTNMPPVRVELDKKTGQLEFKDDPNSPSTVKQPYIQTQVLANGEEFSLNDSVRFVKE